MSIEKSIEDIETALDIAEGLAQDMEKLYDTADLKKEERVPHYLIKALLHRQSIEADNEKLRGALLTLKVRISGFPELSHEHYLIADEIARKALEETKNESTKER